MTNTVAVLLTCQAILLLLMPVIVHRAIRKEWKELSRRLQNILYQDRQLRGDSTDNVRGIDGNQRRSGSSG